MCAVFARELHGARRRRAWLFARDRSTSLVNATRVHLDITRQDLRYAFRSLRRTPGFTVTAILVAALGIGATTATFSIADHVLLRPLPFADPDRLVKLWENQASRGYSRMEPSPPNYLDWKRLATSFDGDGGLHRRRRPAWSASASRSGSRRQRVTGGVFRLLGRQAAIGRMLTEVGHHVETQNPIVISDRLWRTRFGADPERARPHAVARRRDVT